MKAVGSITSAGAQHSAASFKLQSNMRALMLMLMLMASVDGACWDVLKDPKVCGGGPADSMLVSRPACERCAAAHTANLTAAGCDAATVSKLCAALPARWNPLAGLPALPKVHHSVPFCTDNPTGSGNCGRNELVGANLFLDSTDPLQLDYARITRSVPLGVAFGVPAGLYPGCNSSSCFHNKTEVVEAVRTAAKANASLGLYYSPWVNFWAIDPSVRGAPAGSVCASPCNASLGAAAEARELAFYNARLANITRWVGETNAALKSSVKIDAVLFVTEIFYSWSSATERAARTRKADLFYNATKAQLGQGVEVVQYNRGTVNQHKGLNAADPLAHSKWGPAWAEWPGYTPESRVDCYGTSLYAVPELGYTRAMFSHTADNANDNGVGCVVPWIALGVGFQRTVKGGAGGYGDGTTTLNFNWDYEYTYDWVLGREIHDTWPATQPAEVAAAWAAKFAPWSKAKSVAFWPNPLSSFAHPGEGGQDPTLVVPQGNTTHQLMHLVAYVLGAAGTQRLPPGQAPVPSA